MSDDDYDILAKFRVDDLKPVEINFLIVVFAGIDRHPRRD